MTIDGRARTALVGAVALCLAVSGCVPTRGTASLPPTSPALIHTAASDVMPFQPSNSAWYSYTTLRAEKAFARWEQDRDRIELVTWPKSCASVPIGISFTAGTRTVHVEYGPAPRSDGPRQCSPGHVLTSTFVASRAIRRDRPTTLVLGGARILLPEAPAMVPEPVSPGVAAPGVAHPLHQVSRPLPQYSVRDSPWTLTAPTTPASRTISIGWIGGTCQPNASIAYVVETTSTVTIDTALAPPALSPKAATPTSVAWCAGVGKSLSAEIRLHSPLGTRTLLQHQFAHRPADENAY